MRGKAAENADIDGPRPVVFGCHRADAQSSSGPVIASDYRVAAPPPSDGQMNARPLSLGIGKSIVIDLPRDIKDVLVADPKIANAVVRSSQRAYIIGAAVGQTNIVFFDSAGQQIAAYPVGPQTGRAVATTDRVTRRRSPLSRRSGMTGMRA